MAAWDDWARRNGGTEPEYGENGYDPRYEQEPDSFSEEGSRRRRGSQAPSRMARESRVKVPDDDRAARTRSSYGS